MKWHRVLTHRKVGVVALPGGVLNPAAGDPGGVAPHAHALLQVRGEPAQIMCPN